MSESGRVGFRSEGSLTCAVVGLVRRMFSGLRSQWMMEARASSASARSVWRRNFCTRRSCRPVRG